MVLQTNYARNSIWWPCMPIERWNTSVCIGCCLFNLPMKKKDEKFRLGHTKSRGRGAHAGLENVLIKWINTSIYWIIIIIGLIRSCCSIRFFSEALAGVQIVIFQITVFFLSFAIAIQKFLLIYFQVPAEFHERNILIFGLFPRNFVGASSFRNLSKSRKRIPEKHQYNHIFRSYWNAQCEPITQIESDFGRWTYMTESKFQVVSVHWTTWSVIARMFVWFTLLHWGN